MNAEQLVKENNKKRKQLNKENLNFYEDILVYLRLSFDKSEEESEEILMEMLDHLLDAQAEGKTAEDVFGSHPKQYLHDLMDELPKMVTKKRIKFLVMAAFYFIGAGAVFSGLWDLVAYYAFQSGTLSHLYYLGTASVTSILQTLVAISAVIVMVQVLRWTCFKNFSYIKEFLYLWLIIMPFICMMFAIYIFIPDFGAPFSLSTYFILSAGLISLGLGWLTQRRI